MRTRLFAILLLGPFLFQACKCSFMAGNLTTAKFGELVTYNDKDFSQKTSQFGPMGPIYARVKVTSNPGDVKVEFRFVVKEAGAARDVILSDFTRRVDLEGDNYARYWLTPSVPFSPGNYSVETDLIFKNKVIDHKSVEFKIVPEALAPMPPLAPGSEAADFME